jgi:hypothetical protein
MRFGGTPRPNFVHPWTNSPRTLWDKFFARRQSDWPAAWTLQSDPMVRDIEFLNAERTKAIVMTGTRGSGTAVIVEKPGSTWIRVEILYTWDT